jgi:iron complex outermembrane receptor protein
LFRAVYSRAPRSSNIYDTYVDQIEANYPAGYQKSIQLEVIGNKNLKLLTAGMLEIGYRGNLNSHLSIDVELFDTHAKNYNAFVSDVPYNTLNGSDTIQTVPAIVVNLPLILHQTGITVSLNYNSRKLQIKPFVTFQQTRMRNYAPFLATPEYAPTKNIYSAMGTETIFKATPTTFGGVAINYILTARINVNLSAYYYSSQIYHHVSNLIFNDGIRGIDHIPAKLIINANISYEAVKGLRLFCSGKNMLNNKSREFFKSDAVPFMLLGGLSYEF